MRPFRHTLPLIAAAALTLTPLAGCSMFGGSKAPAPSVSAVNHGYKSAMSSAITSIKAGELDQADAALEKAIAAARTSREREQVRSLRLLVDGSRAMYQGDAKTASAKWDQIPDAKLREQVRANARKVGFDLPKPDKATQKSDDPAIALGR